MNPLAVVLLTYERTSYALTTLRSFFEYAHYSGPIHLHIADDGSRQEHRDILANYAADMCPTAGLTFSNAEHHGYGHNYNLALQSVHSIAPLILPLEDDWELTRPLDLDPIVEDLEAGEFGCCRLGYIGFSEDLRCKFFYTESKRMYLALRPQSPERHVFAGHPRLETRDWERSVGPWPEGLSPGDTEFQVAGREQAREGVVWPLDLIKSYGDLFVHIGTIRSTEVEAERATV